MLPPPSGTHPTPDPSTLPPDAYEFSPAESVVIAQLGSKMHFVGLFVIGIGVVVIGTGVYRRELGLLFIGVLYGVFGYWTEHAGASFRRVAETKGHDLRHLMTALEDLRKFFTLQYWLCVVMIAAAVVLLSATMLGGGSLN